MPKFSNNVKNVVLVELFYYILVKTEKLPKCIALSKKARLGGKKLSIVFRVSGGKLLERGKYWHWGVVLHIMIIILSCLYFACWNLKNLMIFTLSCLYFACWNKKNLMIIILSCLYFACWKKTQLLKKGKVLTLKGSTTHNVLFWMKISREIISQSWPLSDCFDTNVHNFPIVHWFGEATTHHTLVKISSCEWTR